MIKSITLENFFSFCESTKISLNPETNILVGINGSGKSNFLKAIRILYEGIAGNGFEKLFLKDWGGFSSVGNYNESQQDTIKIIYEFDKDKLNQTIQNTNYDFRSNPIYEITIHKMGATSYFLEEYIHSQESNTTRYQKPFVFLQMKNGIGKITTREKTVGFQHYPQNNGNTTFKEQELTLRQISDPDRFLPLFALKSAIEAIAVYDYFDTTLKSPIRQPSSYGTDERLLPTGENLIRGQNNNKNLNK
jgi:predicted ATPase